MSHKFCKKFDLTFTYKIIFIFIFICLSCKKDESSYSLNINTVNSGTVDIENGKYASGEIMTLTAAPIEGFAFIGWDGDGLENPTDENPLTFVLDSNKSIVANFVNIENPDFSGMGIWTDEIYSSIDFDFKNNFRSIVEAFVKDAERHGLDLSYVLERDIKFRTEMDIDALAYGIGMCRDDSVEILWKENMYQGNLDQIKMGTKCINCAGGTFWTRYIVGPRAKEYFYGDTPGMLITAYHELGHDILNYSHTCLDGQLMNGGDACVEDISSLNKPTKSFSWYSNDPRFSFRAAVKDLFEGVNQICQEKCPNYPEWEGLCYAKN